MRPALPLIAALALAGCPQERSFDFDGDGFDDAYDCEPENPNIHPDQNEHCHNGVDDDCDGAVDLADDECAAEAEVTVTGVLSFDDTWLGCSASHEVQVGNATGAPLVVRDIGLISTSEQFSVGVSAELPIALATGQSVAFTVEFHPVTAGEQAAVLRVATDSAEFAEVTAPVDGTGVASEEIEDVFTGPGDFPMDLLLVIDDSCSMHTHQQNLAAIGANVIDALDERRFDYHIGFVSIAEPELRNGSQAVIDRDSVNPYGLFATWVVVGTSGTVFDEPPLATSVAAVTPPIAAPGGTNATFLREEADLAVVVLTDEDDQSDGPVSTWVDQLQAIKADPADVTFSAIYALSHGCDGELPAPRLAEAIDLTGGVHVSICEPDWLPFVEQNPAFEVVLDRFALTAWPVPASIAVAVDDEPQVGGWSYDEPDNAIVFDPGSVPASGAPIVVTYAVASGEC
jgi:hypothetical protein